MKKIFENWKTFLKEENINKAMDEASFNTQTAMSVFADESINEQVGKFEYEYSLGSQPNPEVVKRFAKSLYSGKRSGFLSYYDENELAAMDLYLIKGENAGFAIKDGDDIVSAHNNSSLRGLAPEFMRKAKEAGGRRLDHFDGFLSGLYREYGFGDIYEVYQWNEEYKPKGWNYDSVDIFNPKTSIYAYEGNIEEFANVGKEVSLKTEDNFVVKAVPADKVNQYRYGRPDVILRRLK